MTRRYPVLTIAIPPETSLSLSQLCLDLNGTICFGGKLIDGVAERLCRLSAVLSIHVITADTNGNAAKLLAGLPVFLQCIGSSEQGKAKARYVEKLGAEACVCFGNGVNDRLMLGKCGLSIAVSGREGASPKTVSAADVVVHDINDGLDLLLFTERLVATLRD